MGIDIQRLKSLKICKSKKFDLVDLVLETLGYRNHSLGISFEDLVLYSYRIISFIDENGLVKDNEAFELFMINSGIISCLGLEEGLDDLRYILGFETQEIKELEKQKKKFDKVLLCTGTYQLICEMHHNLITNGYAAFIKKKDNSVLMNFTTTKI